MASHPFPERWSQAQGSSGFAVPQLPLSRAGQSPAPQLMSILEMLQRAQVPLPRAARRPAATAALHGDADMRRLWVFWSAPAVQQLHQPWLPCPGRCPRSPRRPEPRARRGLSGHRPSPVPALPAAAGPLCRLSTSPQPHGRRGERRGGSSRYF